MGIDVNLPNVIQGLIEEDYNLLPAVRSSSINKILKSPRHYKYSLTAPPLKSTALDFGTKFHMAILEPERFKRTYSIMPDFGNQTFKANKEKKTAWLSDQTPGKEFITDNEAAQIEGMRDALEKKDNFKYLSTADDMQTELTFIGKVFGRPCKARADAISVKNRRIIDLKTTISARPESFKFSVKDYGYDVQAAFYIQVIAAATLTDPNEWSHYTIAVEKEAPYENQFYSYTKDAISSGLERVGRALELLDECEKSGNWFGYPDIILPLDRPGF